MTALILTLILTPVLTVVLYRATLGRPARIETDTKERTPR